MSTTLKQLETILEANPSEARHWLDYIDALITDGQLDVARQVLALGQRHGLAGDGVKLLQARLNELSANTLLATSKHVRRGATAAELTDQLVTLLNHGQTEAILSVAKTLTIDYPRNAVGWKVLGTVLSQQGQHEEGISALKRAAKITPADPEIYCNLGIAHHSLGQFELAISSLQRAIRLNPRHASAYNSLGLSMHGIGDFAESIKHFRKAISILPDYVEPYSNMGITLQDMGQLDAAVDAHRQAILLNPKFIQAYINLGAVLIEQDSSEEAVATLLAALEIDPLYADAYFNLANAYQNNLHYDKAITHYLKAFELRPGFQGAYNNLLFGVNYHPDLSSEELYAYYSKYEANFARGFYEAWRPHTNDRDPQRRLKVGYVAPAFRKHSTRHFLEPLLAHHDHSQVEVYAYAQLSRPDEITIRYQSYADHWIPTRGMSDAALAERISADGIDILVDITGHAAENRLLVFARKPAPVSLHWLDFGYTTGLTAIDYYLTDAPTVPPGAEAYFAEKPWRLPTPAYAYRAAEGMGEVGSSPAQNKGHITFGTLTRAVRLNYKLIRTWAKLLQAVPGSHLVINSAHFKTVAMQERVAELFTAHGIDRDRLEIGHTSPPWDVLRSIDIGLDCFPHNSGTTLFETLYMGIPFVTLASRPSVGRLGASVLHGVGHPEWIAESEQEYIAKAVALTQDIPALAQLRSQLRIEMQQSPLMDEVGFTRAVEQAYRQMWQLWCAQQQQSDNSTH